MFVLDTFHPVRDPLKSREQNVPQIRADLGYIILYWNSSYMRAQPRGHAARGGALLY